MKSTVSYSSFCARGQGPRESPCQDVLFTKPQHHLQRAATTVEADDWFVPRMMINLNLLLCNKMAGNNELCNKNECANDDSCGPTSEMIVSQALNDGTLGHFPLLPVCTSTPTIQRARPEFFTSAISFPKLDDSGLGDTFHTSPISASLSVTDKESPSIGTAESTNYISASTDSMPSFDSVSRGHRVKLKHSAAGDRISSTPICQTAFSQHPTFSGNKVKSYSDSPVTVSSFQLDFNLHSISKDRSVPVSSLEDRMFRTGSMCLLEDNELTDDEAYFSSSKMSVESPSLTDEFSPTVDRILQSFSPAVPDKLIGRKVGLPFVDIIGELDSEGVPASGVIHWLTSYLMPMDFCRMSGVCQRWRQICLQDKVIARFRNLCFKNHTKPENKENASQRSLKLHSPEKSFSFTRSSNCLGHVQQAVPVPTKLVFSSPALYEKTRQALQWEDIMRHCPMCHSVAKILPGQDRGQCQNQHCQHDFCTRCLSKYHGPVPCSVITKRQRTDAPGSKKSKRNLKRLTHL